MKNKILLGVELENYSRQDILEKIRKYIGCSQDFLHIVSINPENLVLAQKSILFKKVINTAQIKIIDGIGIVLAAKVLNIDIGDRLTGVELMKELIMVASDRRLRVLLIGGKNNLALDLSMCYKKTYPQANFFGLTGIKNIKNPRKEEENKIFSIVSRTKPHLVLVAYGSPDQELWLARHKDKFKGIICMGVGQGFNVYGGIVRRAPAWLQKIGLEWFYRLITQPWRWKRQLRLIKFIWLVIKQKIKQ